MSETIKPGDLRQKLGRVLDRVEGDRDQFVIERRGRPLAALVPYAKYRRLEKAAERDILRILDRDRRQLTRRQIADLSRRAKRKTLTEPLRGAAVRADQESDER